MTITFKPSIIVHCDWGTAPSKRWMAKATLHDGVYQAHAPEPIGDLEDLIPQIQNQRSPGTSTLIGFDFPIGIPATFATSAGITDFPGLLTELGAGKWEKFFELCRHKDEISIYRPFYPYNFTPQGSKSPLHLLEPLKLATANDLLRTCDRPSAQRPAAGALFWTLGPKAPGRGALIAWQHVLQPAMVRECIRIWPFHGDLNSLLKPESTVVAETYPTQYLAAILGKLDGSKTDLAVRRDAGRSILKWAETQSGKLELSPGLVDAIQAGFGQGDDAFDAAIGLFGMIDGIQNYSAALEPKGETVRNIEGWIFGQPAN